MFKLMLLVCGVTVITALQPANAVEKTKKFNQAWPVSGVSTVEISNKYGEVKVVNNGGNQITVDVVVTVEAGSERNTSELLDKINVSFSKSGSTVKAETTIENHFSGSRRMSIDYLVNVPSDKNLRISNKYGNTIVNDLEASGDFDIQYGSLTAVELKAPASGHMNISLAYSNNCSVQEAGDLNLDIKYSGINISEARNIKLRSSYSNVDVEEAGVLQIESKYDKFNFGEVESVTANTKYTNTKVGQIAKVLNYETGYGSLKVGEISKTFESVSVTSSYGQVSLGLQEASYTVNATCEYCGISYPESQFKGNKMKERNTTTIEGKVGSGNGGKVMIKSRYGEIKLVN